ncbi:MAG TPA: hypothetical protein VMZ91_15060, partial [Candidatus Paceibacterota bacterium]|nr:hypothetical protein [Candidatus Paceibacterota bacterium]
MRLKEYITEMSKEYFIVNKIVNSRKKLFYEYLKDDDWTFSDKDIEDALNILYKDIKPPLTFHLTGDKADGGYSTIISADFDINGKKIVVNVFLPKDISKYFEKYKDPENEKYFLDLKRNEFLSDLVNMLSHEFRHLGQIKSSNFKIPFINPEELDIMDFWKYLASDAEIDAFSYQAAIEYLKTGKNGVSYNLYNHTFNPDKKKLENELAKKKDRSGSKYKNIQNW